MNIKFLLVSTALLLTLTLGANNRLQEIDQEINKITATLKNLEGSLIEPKIIQALKNKKVQLFEEKEKLEQLEQKKEIEQELTKTIQRYYRVFDEGGLRGRQEKLVEKAALGRKIDELHAKLEKFK